MVGFPAGVEATKTTRRKIRGRGCLGTLVVHKLYLSPLLPWVFPDTPVRMTVESTLTNTIVAVELFKVAYEPVSNSRGNLGQSNRRRYM